MRCVQRIQHTKRAESICPFRCVHIFSRGLILLPIIFGTTSQSSLFHLRARKYFFAHRPQVLSLTHFCVARFCHVRALLMDVRTAASSACAIIEAHSMTLARQHLRTTVAATTTAITNRRAQTHENVDGDCNNDHPRMGQKTDCRRNGNADNRNNMNHDVDVRHCIA